MMELAQAVMASLTGAVMTVTLALAVACCIGDLSLVSLRLHLCASCLVVALNRRPVLCTLCAIALFNAPSASWGEN